MARFVVQGQRLALRFISYHLRLSLTVFSRGLNGYIFGYWGFPLYLAVSLFDCLFRFRGNFPLFLVVLLISCGFPLSSAVEMFIYCSCPLSLELSVWVTCLFDYFLWFPPRPLWFKYLFVQFLWFLPNLCNFSLQSLLQRRFRALFWFQNAPMTSNKI